MLVLITSTLNEKYLFAHSFPPFHMSSFVLAQSGMTADRDARGCPSTFGSLFTQLRDPAFECGWGNEGRIKLSGKAILLSFFQHVLGLFFNYTTTSTIRI